MWIHRSEWGSLAALETVMATLNRLAIVLVLVGSCSTLVAQQESVSIEDFAFLTGYWKGEGFGGISEEMWMPASGDKMFGVFKQSSETELVFSEYMEITEVEGKFQLRLKHFNPDFSGWEESDDHEVFELLSVSADKAVFDGLSYELVDSDGLKVELKIGQPDGSVSTEVFSYHRQAL
jgi:hypothetical protein